MTLHTVPRTKNIRFDTNYGNLATSCDFLTAEDFINAEVRAKALSFDEVLDYLAIELDDIPPVELELLRRAHKRGRVSAISTAADNLFQSMSNRNGHQASLAYLQQLSGTFHLDVNPSNSPSAGFNFNVVLKED